MELYDEYGEPLRRLFDPAQDRGLYRIPRNQLVVYNAEKHISQLQYQAIPAPQPERDEGTMVVHIDGACRNNGQPNARAAYGVYFGATSPYNTSGLLPATIPQTSTRAEIEALGKALDVIESICADDFELQQIVLATDSKFLVNAMSRWIEGWIDAGGIGASGRIVAHFERLKELHETLDEMEYGHNGGIEVKLWHVSRELNRAADALANSALDR